MRAAADNFSIEELREAVEYAHERHVKVYLTVNTMPRENEYPLLREYFSDLSTIPVDALIIADLGVFEYAKKYAPKVDRHISTQAGVTNYASANVLYNMGASRVVLAREIPLDEIAEMLKNGMKQKEIAERLHISQQTVSYRMGLIRTQYPELM
jgi:putative protease